MSAIIVSTSRTRVAYHGVEGWEKNELRRRNFGVEEI